MTLGVSPTSRFRIHFTRLKRKNGIEKREESCGRGCAWEGGPEELREPDQVTTQREATFFPSHLAWESGRLGSGPGSYFLMILSKFLE